VRHHRRLVPVLVGALLVANSAAASKTFPGALEEALGMECPPACTICHRDETGGRNTVIKRFGIAMMVTGELSAGETDRIPAALAAIQGPLCSYTFDDWDEGIGEEGPCDADGDGVSDVDELRQKRDPNVLGPNDELRCGPDFGCGARVEPRSQPDYVAILAAALTVLGLAIGARRRKRR
jgi:hypothetical protein